MKPPLFRWPDMAVAPEGEEPLPLRTRVLWMFGIWFASIATLGAVAMVLRWVLKT